ncbi:MAG: SMC family ATPase [Nocardioides sp.]|nr:SMC family ATPase [Nocardioides sp.]
MRLHHLTVQAFGPFPGRETVDFDSLHEAGLFLLAGPTGAGKSSLLDAVCFALYGQVPGIRDTRTLKSQHASETARPEVCLELTLRGRRYRVRRSPEWERPKRRGEGTTTERSAVTLQELEDGTERLLASRAQDVGHHLGELIGLSAAQFLQVALLPQGEFQHFLHATSQERHGLLSTLFGTHRFAEIEDWVADHGRTLGRQARSAQERVEQLAHTLADRAGRPLPDPEGLPVLPVDVARVREKWAQGVLTDLTAVEASACATVAIRRTAAETAETTYDAAAAAHDLHTRAVALQTRARRLAAEAPVVEQQRAAVAAHARAERVAPLLASHDEAADAWSRALAAVITTCSSAIVRPYAADLLAPVRTLAADPAQAAEHPDSPEVLVAASLAVRELVDDLRSRAADAEALAPLRAELEARHREVADLAARRVTLEEELDDGRQRTDDLPSATESARSALTEARALAGTEATCADALRALDEALVALDALPAARARAADAADAARHAHDTTLAARESHLALVERRVAGMAAELAAGLVDGEDCPVCGSAAHPRPRPAGPDAVDRDAQAAAEALVRSTADALEAARTRSAEADDEVRALDRVVAGRDRTILAAAIVDRRDALGAAREAAGSLDDREALLQGLVEESRALRAREHELVRALRDLDAEASTAAARAAVLTEQVSTGGASAAEPEPTSLRAAAGALAGLGEAIDSARTRLHHLATTHASLAPRLTETDFADVGQAREALLAPDDAAERDAACRVHEQEVAAVAEALADPVLAAAADHEPPPLTDADEVRRRARAALDEALADLARTTERRVHAERLAAELHKALQTWVPAAEEHARADGLARLVRGTGHDNVVQMRLSSYVLATRLDQVIDAANTRLALMRDQRYLLQRSARTGRRGTPSGLELEVLDQWTGAQRAPSTLSGGETFVLALSLALGLADVVSQEAGGVPMEMLFVDEGFGMLDPDTLDDVLDRLDELRAGGRSVGVVSHVAEMRSRIPVQVHVHKARAGSTVTQTGEVVLAG